MTDQDRPSSWYRSEGGIFLGLCKGLAEWRDVPVFWVRFAMVIFTVFTFPLPVFLYIVLAFIISKAPEQQSWKPENSEYRSVSQTLDSLERRTRRVEDAVVNRETDWDRRFHDK
ncbi:MAG: PspC domain-containing protein [Opitutales bacterium]